MSRVFPALLIAMLGVTMPYGAVAGDGAVRFAGVGSGIDLSRTAEPGLLDRGDATEAAVALGVFATAPVTPPRQSSASPRPLRLSIGAAAAPVPRLDDEARPTAGRLGIAASGRPSAYVSARDNGGVVGLTYKIKPPAAPSEVAD